jgi:hypothetical protein
MVQTSFVQVGTSVNIRCEIVIRWQNARLDFGAVRCRKSLRQFLNLLLDRLLLRFAFYPGIDDITCFGSKERLCPFQCSFNMVTYRIAVVLQCAQSGSEKRAVIK